ncbi:MAG: molecular chaperone HtpG [Eubacteriales bacterium]|jgi:molecular chaperone HtpG
MSTKNPINEKMTGEGSTEKHMRAGGISVETDHIFPIIKKWLYSDKDIFLREIVSNAADAITKMKRLCSLGQAEADGEDYKILVRVDKTAKTLVVEDNGIGMTEDELTRYICQIALSGALEFIEKYEGTPTEGSADSGIIGHFGLGFYSAFMVSEKVEIITKSYTGAPALRWVCSDNGSYEIYDSDSESRGTSVIMHIADEEAAYLEAAKVREILDKYCAFMPYEIYLETGEEDEKAEKKPINTTSPLWLKRPNECTEEEYNEFYHKVFGDFRDPLFSIHINADYPFNFKGILYFPRLRTEFDNLEGRIKLYYNQVFVADNVKEVVPEYLFMLRGVIDCPELPLNVSRSYLQNNVYVSKVSAHIVKKICDKLGSLCQNNRAEYEKIWGDIRVFVEFASVSDRKFFDRVKDSLLLGLTDKTFVTINEYREAALKDAAGDDKEKAEVTVYYTSDPAQQSQYISMFTAQGYKVAVLDHPIDTQFITSAERVYEGLKFVRVDADISALAIGTDEKEKENKEIVKLFRKAAGDDKLNVKFVSLKDNRAPTLLNLPEDKRRMDDFMKQYSFVTKTEAGPALADTTLVVNTSSPAYTRLLELVSADVEKAEFLAGYIYKLSLMAHRRLDGEELSAFLSDSYDIICGI